MSLERISTWPYEAKGKTWWRIEVRPLAQSGQKPLQRSRFVNQDQALRAAMSLRDEMDSGFNPTNKKTVAEACELFLEDKRGLVSEHTRANYSQTFRLYVLSSLGQRLIGDLQQTDLEALLKQLAVRVRLGTLHTVATRVRMLFKFAEGKRLIVFNPAVHMRIPAALVTKPSQVQSPWTKEEGKAALAAFSGHRLELFVYLLVFLGCRKGEALGLTWEDIDFESGELSFNRSRSTRRALADGNRIKTSDIDGPTKNKRSRTLRIPQTLLQKLLSERNKGFVDLDDSGAPKVLSGYIVSNDSGEVPSISRVTKEFNEVIDNAGIRRIRLHDLRHTAAVLSLNNGTRLEATSQSLGHASTDFTKRTYASYVPALADEFADGITKALG